MQTIRPGTVLILPCALAATLALAAPAAASPPTCDDALRAVQGGDTLELTLACDDARDRRLSYQARMPLHGSLSLDQTGHGRYTPMLGFEGTDTFSYWATAGGEESNHATVSGTGPDAFTCDNATGEAQAGERLTVTASCHVPDGSNYRYHIESKPRHGYLKLERSGSGIWQADPAYTGSDEFTYWATAKTPAGELKSSLGSLRVSFTRRNPPLKPPQFTISRAAGSPRVKVGGRWQALTRARSFTQPVVVDTRGSRIKLAARHGLDSSGTGALSSGSFSRGMFKVDHGPAQGPIAPRYYAFNKLALAGPPDCEGPGRAIEAVVRRGTFTVKNARFSVTASAPSRIISGDIGCMGISNVQVESGRITGPGGQVLHKHDTYHEPQR